ncbi:MAG: aspartate/glutamate racemase family protein [Actinomycetia bacterium]|nr:aspartate/glutamate racemase family protein [Actinomycetes bacterium]
MSESKAIGGRTVYGAAVGILMLDTCFPRVLGDVGHAMTWPFPVLYRVVHGATGESVTTARPDDSSRALVERFVEAGKDLVRDGADGLATSCGFLSLFQQELADRCGVPVATSSLLQIPLAQALLPAGRRVGVLTFNAQRLTSEHFTAVGAPSDTPVVGLETGAEFSRVMTESAAELDIAAARRDMVRAAKTLVIEHKNIGAIVLECTNMGPFARAVQDQTQLPVYDIYTLITWFHAGLRRRDFVEPTRM